MRLNQGPDRTGRQLITQDIVQRTGIDDAMIEELVRTFYGRVRHDALIGPVFEATVQDWEAHIVRLCTFWSSVALMSGRYHGQPMRMHLPLPIDTPHFDRWLEIFARTARDVCPPAAANHFLERAARIADSLELGIAAQKGEIRSKRTRRAEFCSKAEAQQESVPEFNSPACAMREASDIYMGYADKAELILVLNELLEAERDCSLVTLESASVAGSGAMADLLQTLRREEACWGAMLRIHITRLGGIPCSQTGVIYGEAIATTDLGTRVAVLNRGQCWVARKLREVLPRIRDDGLHSDLFDMLRSHEANIELVNGFEASSEPSRP